MVVRPKKAEKSRSSNTVLMREASKVQNPIVIGIELAVLILIFVSTVLLGTNKSSEYQTLLPYFILGGITFLVVRLVEPPLAQLLRPREPIPLVKRRETFERVGKFRLAASWIIPGGSILDGILLLILAYQNRASTFVISCVNGIQNCGILLNAWLVYLITGPIFVYAGFQLFRKWHDWF